MLNLTKEQSCKIQILRGLAIIAVVFIHNTPSGLYQIWGRPLVNFCVGLFLFLSGLLSNSQNYNPQKRIYKILIPYIIWTFFYVVIANYKNPINIPISYLKAIITANACAVMYYVFVYIQFALLIPLIDKIAKSKYKYWALLITPVEIIVMRLLPLVLGLEINKYVATIMHVSCLAWFIYFYLGCLLGNNYVEIKMSVKRLIIFWSISIILQIMEGYYYFSLGERNCGTQLKLTSILSGVLFSLLMYKFINKKINYKFKILKFLGDYSFGIFFAHLAVMYVLKRIPYYSNFQIYPINAIVTIIVTAILVFVGRKMFKEKAKYFAL